MLDLKRRVLAVPPQLVIADVALGFRKAAAELTFDAFIES